MCVFNESVMTSCYRLLLSCCLLHVIIYLWGGKSLKLCKLPAYLHKYSIINGTLNCYYTEVQFSIIFLLLKKYWIYLKCWCLKYFIEKKYLHETFHFYQEMIRLQTRLFSFFFCHLYKLQIYFLCRVYTFYFCCI